MGIPVDLDVVKYTAAEEAGRTAPQARKDAALNEDAVFEMAQIEQQKRQSAKETKQTETAQAAAQDNTAVQQAADKGSSSVEPVSSETVAADMAK